MMPLILRLKKEAHKKIALAQDIMVKELYSVFNNAVMHGGTAIWRCYSGNRFSEDIDVYIPKDPARINAFFENLKKRGFAIEKKKIGENSLFSNLKFENTYVRFEALFKKANGSLKEYETADGNFVTIYTLTPEELISEKAGAYIKRLKIRDLYDVFFLLRYVKDREKVRKSLQKLLKNYKKPVDEKELKVLILEGLVPATEKMLEYIKDFVR